MWLSYILFISIIYIPSIYILFISVLYRFLKIYILYHNSIQHHSLLVTCLCIARISIYHISRPYLNDIFVQIRLFFSINIYIYLQYLSFITQTDIVVHIFIIPLNILYIYISFIDFIKYKNRQRRYGITIFINKGWSSVEDADKTIEKKFFVIFKMEEDLL